MLMYMYSFKILQPGMEIQDFPEIGEWNFKNFLTKFTFCD